MPGPPPSPDSPAAKAAPTPARGLFGEDLGPHAKHATVRLLLNFFSPSKGCFPTVICWFGFGFGWVFFLVVGFFFPPSTSAALTVFTVSV